ncbi:hypothetical protein [Pseudooceanicola lipolyticus]|nr:hypothetical protein [Pseudooceanicola lipolyticus]
MALSLTMAISDYAHTRDLVTGRIRPEGIDLNILSYPFEQVGLRFALGREFDVSEYSLAGFCAHVANTPEPEFVGLPVFPSRVFRQSSFFINDASGITSVDDLRGKRVGLPQWSQTATVYARGYLAHDVGLDLRDISWVQAGVNSPGRKEGVDLALPEGIDLVRRPDSCLSDMLAAGDIDCAISARPPNSFLQGDRGVRRLFPDPQKVEEEYFRRTGIFPIMHVLVVRRDIYEANRWIMRNLMDAFNEAKARAFDRFRDITTSFAPLGWGPSSFEASNRLLFPDGEPWPYGVRENAHTLNTFLTYCHEQGVTRRRLRAEDIFPPECSFEVIV